MKNFSGVKVVGGNSVSKPVSGHRLMFLEAAKSGNLDSYSEALVPAVLSGDFEMFKGISRASYGEKARCSEMNLALMHASRTGDLNVVKYIVQLTGERINVMLAFRIAIQNGHSKVVEYFVEECGMKFSLADEFLACFKLALAERHFEVLGYLASKFRLKMEFLPTQMNQVRFRITEMATA